MSENLEANSSRITEFLLGLIRRRPVGHDANLWELNCLLPIAPTLEESLRIVSQNWDMETVDFYISDVSQKHGQRLMLVQGRPVHIEGLSSLMFAVHTDKDHRFPWRVTELSTGAAMSKPQPGEKEALDAVQKALNRFGVDYFMRSIQNLREQQAESFQRNELLTSPIGVVSPEEANKIQSVGLPAEPGDLRR